MNIYKLQYTDHETANADFLDKGVLETITVDGEEYIVESSATQAIVNLDKLVKTPATYDENDNKLTSAVYHNGVFYDVMTTEIINFGSNSITPTNCTHSFAGFDINACGTGI